MKPAIEVNGIGKKYLINHKNKASYSTLKDDLANIIKRPLGLANMVDGKEETFWALKNVSFEVPKGEIFGIIGRNGSGKSTLLKILSRIVSPTEGDIVLRGRTASLLEVGTGFHPELTGRENVYFNGSMLGMTRKEIGRKFNEIVEFSEIGQFIDTPVKYYSSGMYVRLAFSVAAHLEPDILILDEVLSVGDFSFQQKSMKKIKSIMQGGATVLFVSHSMASVQQLCTKGILLNDGQVEFIGETDELAARYMKIMQADTKEEPINWIWEKPGEFPKNDFFIPEKIYLCEEDGKIIKTSTGNNREKWFTIEGEVIRESPLLTIGLAVFSPNNSLLFSSYPTDINKNEWKNLKKGTVKLRAKIPSHLLNEGKYRLSLIGGIHNKFWLYEPGTVIPSIEMEISGGLSESPYWKNAREGSLAPIINWEVKNI